MQMPYCCPAACSALLTNMVKHPLPCDTSNYTRLPQTLVTSWELMKTAPTQQQQLAQHGRQRTQQQNAGHGTDTAAGTLEPPAEGDNGREEGEAPLPDSSMLRPGSQSAVNQQGALDEGEIPGKPECGTGVVRKVVVLPCCCRVSVCVSLTLVMQAVPAAAPLHLLPAKLFVLQGAPYKYCSHLSSRLWMPRAAQKNAWAPAGALLR